MWKTTFLGTTSWCLISCWNDVGTVLGTLGQTSDSWPLSQVWRACWQSQRSTASIRRFRSSKRNIRWSTWIVPACIRTPQGSECPSGICRVGIPAWTTDVDQEGRHDPRLGPRYTRTLIIRSKPRKDGDTSGGEGVEVADAVEEKNQKQGTVCVNQWGEYKETGLSGSSTPKSSCKMVGDH